MRTPEGKVEDHLTKRCKSLKFMCLKFTSPGTTGVPDRIVIGNGRTVFIELKRPGGSLRRLQAVVIADMREHGATVRVADTEDVVDEALAEIVRAPKLSTAKPWPDIDLCSTTMATLESTVEKYLTQRCKKLKFMCLKFTSPGTTGVPDRIVIGNAQTVFIELKRPGGAPRRLQEVIIAQMRSHGAVVRVADSKDAVDNVLAQLIASSAATMNAAMGC